MLKLKILNLSYNQIVDTQPLSNLLELEELYLELNFIRDIRPLFELKKLFRLDLNEFRIANVELCNELMRWKTKY
jgi:internalin A